LGARHVVRTVVDSEDTAKPARKLNTDACAVWDLNQSAWRSFRWDRMKKIEVLAETDSIPVASTT
jgi:predicted DNA-binding transcriptional regulator YafY